MGTTPYASPASVETETRLRAAGEAGWLGPGDVELDGGTGVAARNRVDGGAVMLDALPSARSHTSSLYIPSGDLADGWVAQLTNADPQLRTFLQALDVNTDDPVPAGTGATDHLAVQVSGTGSGQQQLGLHPNPDRHFAFDGLTLEQLGKTGGSGSFLGQVATGIMSRFRASADTTLTAMGLDYHGNNLADFPGFGGDVDRTMRYSILNADRTEVLTETLWTPTSVNVDSSSAAADDLLLQFIRSLDVQTGDEMWVVAECDPSEPGLQPYTTGSPSGSFTSSASGNEYCTWGVDHPDGDRFTATVPDADNRNLNATLYGSPGGVLLVGGLITVEVVAVGAPPAYTGGANVHLRHTGSS